MTAACAFWANDYSQSATSAQQGLQRAPKDSEALYWSVKANEHLAVEAFSEVDTLAPNSAVTHDLVGDLYRFQRQADSALVEYGKALAIEPHDPAALLGAAATYLSVSRYDEATAAAQKALADRPTDPQTNLLVAEILGAEGHEEDAAPYLAKCANVTPQFQPRVHYLLGRVAVKSGNVPEAIHQMEQALPGDEDGSIHYQLSRMYRRVGDLPKAQAAEAQAKALVAQREANAGIALRESMAGGR
jgi:predicted Zn-dependent protease